MMEGQNAMLPGEAEGLEEEPTFAFGAIESLTIPDGWQRDQTKLDSNIAFTSHSFSPPDASNLALTFYYRGRPVSKAAAQDFLDVLKMQPHSITDKDSDALNDVLGSISDSSVFTRSNCETIELAGKVVLRVDGIWTVTNLQFSGILVNTDPDGREVTEVFLEGLPDQFERYKQEFEVALQSIKWR